MITIMDYIEKTYNYRINIDDLDKKYYIEKKKGPLSTFIVELPVGKDYQYPKLIKDLNDILKDKLYENVYRHYQITHGAIVKLK